MSETQKEVQDYKSELIYFIEHCHYENLSESELIEKIETTKNKDLKTNWINLIKNRNKNKEESKEKLFLPFQYQQYVENLKEGEKKLSYNEWYVKKDNDEFTYKKHGTKKEYDLGFDSYINTHKYQDKTERELAEIIKKEKFNSTLKRVWLKQIGIEFFNEFVDEQERKEGSNGEKIMPKLHVDIHGNVLNPKIKLWHEREKLPRVSAKKTSLKEFYFNWKKR